MKGVAWYSVIAFGCLHPMSGRCRSSALFTAVWFYLLWYRCCWLRLVFSSSVVRSSSLVEICPFFYPRPSPSNIWLKVGLTFRRRFFFLLPAFYGSPLSGVKVATMLVYFWLVFFSCVLSSCSFCYSLRYGRFYSFAPRAIGCQLATSVLSSLTYPASGLCSF